MKVIYLQQHALPRIGMVIPFYDLEIGEVAIDHFSGNKIRRLKTCMEIMWASHSSRWDMWITETTRKDNQEKRVFTTLMLEIIDEG